MSEQKMDCPMCRTNISVYPDYDTMRVFYRCPVCGRYELGHNGLAKFDHNHLAPYLYYNRYLSDEFTEYRYHTDLSKEVCDQYKAEFEQGKAKHGRPVHMDSDMVENWYPKTFAERVDRILLQIESIIPHIGQSIKVIHNEAQSLLFIDRKDRTKTGLEWREVKDCKHEEKYMVNYLEDQGYIKAREDFDGAYWSITLTPSGYSRVDELQKNTAHGRNALVAMQFGDETLPLREAIRKGVSEAGYNAIFIDEVQHNDFITPELLKYIRDSKFVVVDLTHKNNGAYYEEGYAMGLGKPVIQLCRKETQLHFDIAQKNTIMWGTENDIPELLANRIKATID